MDTYPRISQESYICTEQTYILEQTEADTDTDTQTETWTRTDTHTDTDTSTFIFFITRITYSNQRLSARLSASDTQFVSWQSLALDLSAASHSRILDVPRGPRTGAFLFNVQATPSSKHTWQSLGGVRRRLMPITGG